ncbi:glycosyltransferase family 39 protein [bacterium]|nr:glycosyltransferase family 39 protein [bacterium]
MPRRAGLIIFTVLLVLVSGVRFWHLDADPPWNLSDSGGYFADEGFWTHNARNMILWGEPVQDGWNNMYVSPLLHLATVGCFKLFGVTLYSARLVPVVLSLISLVLLYSLLYREGEWSAVLLLLLLGLNYIFVVYSRIAIVEVPATFLLVLASIFLMRSEKRSVFVSGIILACAYLTKTTLVFIIPAAFATLISHGFLNRDPVTKRKNRVVTEIIMLAIGLAIPLILWTVIIYRPYGTFLAGYNEYYRHMLIPSTITGFIKALLSQPFHIFFNRTPVLLVVSHIYALLVLYDLIDRCRRINRIEHFAWFWYVGGLIFLALFKYRPLRYYVPIMPAMVILSSIFFNRLVHEGPQTFTCLLRGRRWLITLIWLLIPLAQNLGLLVDRYVFHYGLLHKLFHRWPAIGIWYPGTIMVVLLCLIMIASFIRLRKENQCQQQRAHAYSPTTVLASVLLIMFVTVNGWSLISWLYEPEYTLLETNLELAKFPARGAFTGQWAGELCLQTPHRVVPVFKDFVNDQTPFDRYHIRYALLWQEYQHKELFIRDFPEIEQRMRFIKEYWIKRTTVYFFALPKGPD